MLHLIASPILNLCESRAEKLPCGHWPCPSPRRSLLPNPQPFITVLPNAELALSARFSRVSEPDLLRVHLQRFCASGALQSLDQLLQSSCAFPLIVPFRVGGEQPV